MTIHELKTWPHWFQWMLAGTKTFEYRKNDRGFQCDDILCLNEWDAATESYTGRHLYVEVTAIVWECPGLPEGYCIMQTAKVRRVDGEGRDVTDLPGLWDESDRFVVADDVSTSREA